MNIFAFEEPFTLSDGDFLQEQAIAVGILERLRPTLWQLFSRSKWVGLEAAAHLKKPV
jgi:hypothetical protein